MLSTMASLRLALAVVAISAGPLAAQPAADPMELVKEGRRLNSAGKQDEALALYARALASDPNLFDAHLAAGVALDLKGDYRKAREHLQKAIDLAPADARVQALSAMGVSYAFEAKAAEAAEFYKRQFDLQVTAGALDAAAATANALGRVFLESGDTANAQTWYETGYRTAKKLANLPADQVDLWELRYRHALSRIAARQGDAAAAATHAAAVKALVDKGGPNAEQAPVYQYLVGYNALYAKKYDQALAALAAADQRDPFILGLMARAYEAAGNQAAAREACERVMAVNAHNIQNAFSRPLARQKLAELK